MRTKALILSAALVAAGVASSMAQSNVYSLNVVGYVNLTVTPGFNLISLPLQSSDPNNNVNSVMTNITPVLQAGLLYTYNNSTATFNDALQPGGDGNWYDDSFNYVTNNTSEALLYQLPPGKGFFLYLPPVNEGGVASAVITVVGTVLQGTNTYPVTQGYGFYGNFEPVAGDICTNGFPVNDSGLLYTYNQAGSHYNNAFNCLGTDDGGFTGPDANGSALTFAPSTYGALTTDYATLSVYSPAVGAAFLYYTPSGGTVTWSNIFTVQ